MAQRGGWRLVIWKISGGEHLSPQVWQRVQARRNNTRLFYRPHATDQEAGALHVEFGQTLQLGLIVIRLELVLDADYKSVRAGLAIVFQSFLHRGPLALDEAHRGDIKLGEIPSDRIACAT